MQFGLDLRQLDDLMIEVADLPHRANASIAETMNFLAQSTAQRAKNRIRTGGRSGRVYGSHTASAPGEPPANLSGALAASIRFTKMTDRPNSFATAGTDLAYGTTLEFGGWTEGFGGQPVYIDPRPFIVPSFEEAIANAEIELKRRFEKRMRK